MPEWLTVREYAARFHVSRPTVYKWRAQGLLTVISVYKIIRIRNEPPKSPESTKAVVKSDVSHFQSKTVNPIK